MESEKLKIKIHRGANQIGGCATEMEYKGERILIDLGANLPGTDESSAICDARLLDSVFGKERDQKYDAILFTHYHGDHYGLYKEIPNSKQTPLYMGKTAKKILKIVTEYIDRNAEIKGKEIVKAMREYERGKMLDEFKHFKIMPLSVDHSAIDAYMLYIEVGGKRILYTGDFRGHGIANEREQIWRTLDKYVGKDIDLLITEGTMLNRIDEAKKQKKQGIYTEENLGKEAAKQFAKKDFNFVMVSSTNLDSIMEFYQNTPNDKWFICDEYQARILVTAMEDMGQKHWQYRSKADGQDFYKKICIVGKIHKYFYRDLQIRGQKLKEKSLPPIYIKHVEEEELDKQGFVMLTRPNRYFEINGLNLSEKMFLKFRQQNEDKVNLIYSMWEGYVHGDKADKDIIRFIDDFPYIPIHTSGHAYVETIQELIKKVEPKEIIPMHTEYAEGFHTLDEFKEYEKKIRHVVDGKDMFF